MTDPNLGAIRYAALCAIGTRQQGLLEGHLGRRRKIAYLLMRAEEEHYTEIPRYRAELADIKAQINEGRGELMRHVAHCTDGCTREKNTTLSASAFANHRAPTHQKPELPRMAEIAARLRNGEALEAIAVEYERNPYTLIPKLNAAGFHSSTGRPVVPPRKTAYARPLLALIVDEPWRDQALCVQTDPEAFFPEKGGSTREAKSVCARCTVSAECLDSALAKEERFGIWGGLSERDRRKVTKAMRAAGDPTTETTYSGPDLDQESA